MQRHFHGKNRLNLATLQERIFIVRVAIIMMYKILNDLTDISTCYFTPNHYALLRRYFTQLPTRVNSFTFFHLYSKFGTLDLCV